MEGGLDSRPRGNDGARRVDVAVIGAGTAGLAAYRAARAAGASAVLIEGGPYGTTCARVGCMPSKLLIAAAEAAHGVERAAGFGVHAKACIDGPAVMARVRAERDRFVGFVLEGMEAIPSQDRIQGRARFVSAQRLDVDGLAVEAASTVIATGSRPSVPRMLQGLGDRLVVNDDVFDWSTLPRSVAVFGPGVIGLELGQALARLGVRVVVLGRGGRLGPLADPEVRRAALAAFQEELEIDPDADVTSVKRVREGVEIDYRARDGQRRRETFEYVLAATGRVPNLDSLGLENTGLELDSHGVPRTDPHTLQAGRSSVFVAGDAANLAPLLHEAADEGRIAGDNAARFPDVRRAARRAPLSIVFSDPQVAIVGGGFAAAEPQDPVIGEASFDDQGRSRVMLRNRGHLRVYAQRASGRFLGAEMAGPDAEHIGHLLAWSLQAGLTVAQMLEMPFYHPVVEEGLKTALRDADAKLRYEIMRASPQPAPAWTPTPSSGSPRRESRRSTPEPTS